MKPFVFMWLVASTAMACDSPAATQATAEPARLAPAVPNQPDAMNPATPPPPAPYTVRGIIDPGLHNMVAFAIKVPRGWQFRQQFTRKWNGAQPVNQISLKLLAPGGAQQVDFLPERPYYYQDGPTSRSLRQQAISMGMPMPQHDEYELAPMTPLLYIRQVLLPNLARQGLTIQPTGSQEQPAHATGAGATSATGYVDGRLPNGRMARVEVVLNTQARNMNGEVYYNWAALPSITQASAGELAAAYGQTQAARKSFSINPAWQRETQQLSQQGQASNQRITQQDQKAYEAFQRHEQQLNEGMAADRDRSQRQIAEGRGDVLSGKARYDNTATGERYRVDDRYNHVYQDRNGALHGSSVPLDAAALNWQELQRVEMSGY
ncbi:hypothetical protein Q5H92_02490 [Hymenobacter sp. M29]|uniref:Uncharacterized protein n=1 Tax=Hymenobacter mellowenesis TaxID=3063995 RepID=A0ABT9A6R3_9BACT|nr:hypothetical protein [Hymenobacter sp. M29]MDO7845208.1 hypothetical protein [Hymenobacter sp. M29]